MVANVGRLMRSVYVTCVIGLAGEKRDLEAVSHPSAVIRSTVTAAIANIVDTIPHGHVEHLYREGRHLRRARTLSMLCPVDLQEGEGAYLTVPNANGSTL